MNDQLSALSLILTSLSILFSLWQSPIDEVLKIEVKPHSIDNENSYKEALNILNYKAIPLALAALGSFLIFIPDTFSIIKQSIDSIYSKYCCKYDSIQAGFLFVQFLSFLLTLIIIGKLVLLIKKCFKLNPSK
ncbi:hypothetical protein JWG41_04550 [Leptospira sp. 201903075]|uniref:hypothetical protein n=1 Tax=Leptospira chreensis TaxID=2810035 RepID=UPI0019653833|nr:hypothetical protein [Leptospira chreensis]MBM9589702.1 hypothetical protein [Leptospira chreensis]